MSRETLPTDWTVFRDAVRAQLQRDLEAERARARERERRVRPLLARAIEQGRSQGQCTEAWLFGSYAWGMPTERSDLDILAAGCRDPVALAVTLGELTGLDAHVVSLEKCEPSLLARVLAEGLRL